MSVNFRKLKVWEETHNLVIGIYKITKNFPIDEKYNLISQINRAAVSVASNIVEGCGQDTLPSAKRFLKISYASLKELEYQILLSKDLQYLSFEKYQEIQEKIENISKMLYSFTFNLNF